MIMKIDELKGPDDVRAFLEGTQAVLFEVCAAKSERYKWVQKELIRWRYLSLSRVDKGLIIQYLGKVTGYSRQQLTRLIKQYKETGQIKHRPSRSQCFQTKYMREDILLIAKMDELHDTPCGQRLKKLCERAYKVFEDQRYQKLSQISTSHLYNLRKSLAYQQQRRHYEKTQSKPSTIAQRRKPQPNGMPGYIRIDTVHQGDLDGKKGVYHINAVDEVTQFEVVCTVEKISERYLIPVLEQLLELFPFTIINFHSDNGSEYINHQVAKLLKKLLIEFTKSRPRHSNDNALAESKNASVVRKILGYQHISQVWAEQVNEFNIRYLVPYVNFHRPCLYSEVIVDAKGKERKKYPYKLMMTPYEKLKSLPNAKQYLKESLTFEMLDQVALYMSDNEAAAQLQKARAALFKAIHEREAGTV